MKSFVVIVLVVLLGTVAVQCYGPKRNNHRNSHKSHGSKHHKTSQESRGGPSHRLPHSHQGGYYDNSPVWDDRSDSWESREDSGESGYDSYYDSRSSEEFGPSYDEYRDWYDQHYHHKRPCKQPHHHHKPRPKPKPKPTRPTTTHSPPTKHTIPPRTPHTQPTPRPTPTTPKITTYHPPFTPLFTPGPTDKPWTRPTPTTWHPTPSEQDTTHWETTTSIPETTTPEEEFTTLSPAIQDCIDNCASTPEFNPVCGTNGETYDNEGKLFCASACGVNVSIRRRSVCPPPPFFPPDEEESESPPPTPPTTTTTTSSFMGRTPAPSLFKFQQCMKMCRITASFTPVCGTDLITYMNMDRLKCAQSCGEMVEVLCEKPCAVCGFNPVTIKTTTLPPTTAGFRTTTPEPNIQECIKACPVTSEFNPVCGSDRVTYKNPSHLLCAQMCGVGVTIARLSPCGTTTTSTTTTPSPVSTLSPDVSTCIRRCPVTSEYNPVCGTDDLTYTNLGNLECSRYCGVDVEWKHDSRCIDEFDLGTDSTDSSPLPTTTQNVNGNKDVLTTTSKTPTSLFTSPTTAATVPSPKTPTPSTPATRTPTITTTDYLSTSTLGFTIPPDILDHIFGTPSTQEPSSTKKPPGSDEDEDLDLDSRFGDGKVTYKEKETTRSDYGKIIFPE